MIIFCPTSLTCQEVVPLFYFSCSFLFFPCSFTFGLLAFFVVCLSVICEFVSRSGVSHSLSNSVKLISAVSFGNCPCDNRYNQKPVLELAILAQVILFFLVWFFCFWSCLTWFDLIWFDQRCPLAIPLLSEWWKKGLI